MPAEKAGDARGAPAGHAQGEIALLAKQQAGGEKAEAEQAKGTISASSKKRRRAIEDDERKSRHEDRGELKARIEDQHGGDKPDAADGELADSGLSAFSMRSAVAAIACASAQDGSASPARRRSA